VKSIPKWSHLAAVAVMATVMTMSINAGPAMAQSDSQTWQGNSGPSGRPEWNSQQRNFRGNGNYGHNNYYDNGSNGGNRNDRGCGGNGYRNNDGRQSAYGGPWQSWDRGGQGQGRSWQGQNRPSKSRNNGWNGRGNQNWNDGGQDRNDRSNY
jgi:hypothetical protein